jgi:hypothetical protein
MRKLFLMAVLASVVSASFAQKLEDVKKDVSAGKYTDAKTKLDQILADPKMATNSEALFYKAQVYENLGKQSGDTALLGASLEAIKQYWQQEGGKPEGQRALLSTLENHKTLLSVYQDYFKQGADKFQAKDYATAYNNFQRALEAFDILSSRNLTTVKFDTTTHLYAGYAAQNAKMYKEAGAYYEKLINQNITDTTYVGIYNFMITSNLQNKDTAAARKYLQISQERFPQYADQWLEYQTQFLPAEKPQRFDAYEELVKANPKNETLALNYAIELYNAVRASETPNKDSALRLRAESALKNVLAVNPASQTANLLLSQLYWTEYYNVQSQIDNIRGTFPQAVAKKKELTSKVDAIFEKVLPYLQKSYDHYSAETTLKPGDKANYRIVLNQLAEYYTRKKQTAKAAEYQAKAKTVQ